MQLDVIELAKKLISIPSVTGRESEIAKYIHSLFLSLGIKSEFTEAGSVIGIIDGGLPGPTIVLDGHIDTVDVDNRKEWNTDPFVGTVVGDKLFGRGASDMKGAAAAMIAAFSSFIGKKFPGRVIFAGIVEEERFEGIAAREVSSKYKPDYVIIGESTEGRLNIGQRGRAEIVLEAFGCSCHSSNPDKGINAIKVMMRALSVISQMEIKSQEPLGDGILEITDIISSPYPGVSVIPDHVKATFDRRVLMGESAESIVDEINNKLVGIDAKASLAIGETTSYGDVHFKAPRFFPPWLMEKDSFIVKCAENALKANNLFKGIGTYSFCTNGSHYAGEANIATIGYGPGKESSAHTPNEYVPLSDLTLTAEGYKAIISGLLGSV